MTRAPYSMDTRPDCTLAVRGLRKRLPGGVVANDGIDLDIERGEVFGLLGPNGAGKTTLVKQIIGLLRPTSGSILVDGHDVIADPAMARQLCTYLPQGALPIDSFRPREVVELVGRIRGGDRRTVRARITDLIEGLELEPWVDTFGTRLSGGVRRLVGFVMTAVWPSSLVILDEPTNDVDPLRRRLLWKRIRRLGREGSTVLLVTHNVLEAEQVVDRLAVIDEGRIVAQGTPASPRDSPAMSACRSPCSAFGPQAPGWSPPGSLAGAANRKPHSERWVFRLARRFCGRDRPERLR